MDVKVRHAGLGVKIQSRRDLAQRIDDTRLVFKPEDNPEEIIRALSNNALLEGFRAVCVRPEHVKLAKSILKGASVLVATVIGFPKAKEPLEKQLQEPSFGDTSWEDKVAEMDQAKRDGADEFDIVMNTRFFKSLRTSGVPAPEQYELIHLVQQANGIPIKLIIETDLLTDEEIVKATNMAIAAGVAFVKTSTGMLDGGQGATVRNISLIRNTIDASSSSHKPGIKASGGVRTAEQALELLQAGADIMGSSSGSNLLDDFEEHQSS